MNDPIWKIELVVPKPTVEIFASAIEPFGLASSRFEIEGSENWRLEAYCAGMPEKPALSAALALAASVAGITEPNVICAPLPETDWLMENLNSFAPLSIGRFFVYPTHYEGPIPCHAKAIRLDAATAFGSGDHETTAGCLLTLTALAQRMRPVIVLDLGCGSGILGIAAVKLWGRPVLAADIDPESVRVARQNASANGVRSRMTVVRSDGVAAGRIRRSGPFDLILANILAGPLIKLAPTIAAQLGRPGHLVLSGLLHHQRPGVIAAYRRQGLVMSEVRRFGDWPTMVLKKPV
ncbi:MAG: 50S ribosomal protein L11 methyltransferase [Rhodospirillaceae bacterium]|nr:50S ribosomal protein L11 methyltransferase [Rhodospirillaceae bacterium]